jgi:hypothetical protein
VSIVSIAAGIEAAGGRLGLLLAAPFGIGLTLALLRALATTPRRLPNLTQPLPPTELMRHAAQGQAIAIESKPHRGVSRRILLRGSVTLGIGSVLAMMGGVVTDFLWQRNVSGFGGVVTAEPVGDSRPAARRAFWKANSGS